MTILFPFLDAGDLHRDVRARLGTIAGSMAPFAVRFERVGRFPGVVWLAPEPDAAFRLLTARVVAAWPGYPPYGGAYDEVVPHLTIGTGADSTLDRVEELVRACQPFEARARAIEVIVERGALWHRRWRLPLSGPPGPSEVDSPHGRHADAAGPAAPSTRASLRR